MTLVEELIFSLSKGSRKNLRPLQFRGVKKKIFTRMINIRTRSEIEPIDIEKTYKLSKKRYYQIHSEILAACYVDLVPEDGTTLLLALGEKQLFRHFYHEMKKQEARHCKNKAALESYYFQVLLMSNFFTMTHAFHGLLFVELDAYVKRYLAMKTPHPFDSSYQRIYELNSLIEEMRETSLDVDNLKLYTDELEQLYNLVKDGDHILATLVACNSLMRIFSKHFIKHKSQEDYAECCKQLINNNPQHFEIYRDYFELECTLFLELSEQYSIEQQKNFLMKSSGTFAPSLYYLWIIFPKILSSGDLVWAKEYIDKFFPYNIDLLQKDMARSYAVLLMIYYIYTKDFTKGKNYLMKAVSNNTGNNQTLPFTLKLKCFEVYFVAMLEDPFAVELHAERSLR